MRESCPTVLQNVCSSTQLISIIHFLSNTYIMTLLHGRNTEREVSFIFKKKQEITLLNKDNIVMQTVLESVILSVSFSEL